MPLQKTGVLGFPPGPQMSRADSIFNGVREHLKKMLGNSWNCTAITNGRNIEIFCPFLLQRIIQIISELKKEEFSNQTKSRNYNILFIRIWEQYIKKKKNHLNMCTRKCWSSKCLLCFIYRFSSRNTKNKSSLIPSCCSCCNTETIIPPSMNTFARVKKIQLNNLKLINRISEE